MRFAYYIITLTLIAALGAPFFLKRPDGSPLMTWDKFVDDNTPEVVVDRKAYRWQDEQGRWHFSDEPVQETAEQFEIEHNMTTMESKWVREAQAAQQKQNQGNGGTFDQMLKGTDLSIPDAYRGEAMDKAKAAASMLEERGQVLDDLMNQGRSK
ncbi:MAG: DUF4124 domain-containing protein [Pseudomonadota bacterium]